MATLMCFFSTSPTAQAPPSSELLSIDADSSLDALYKLKDAGRLPANWQSLWAHVLVWTIDNGKQRGFESIRLADIFELAAA
ncbi:MAG TPA: hypothetical protein VGI40_04580 [Pirellulaceae bacterium]|jgi:hypothetical protein